jgi:hypothetical protein
VVTDVHSILYWIDKNNPFGPKPENPNNDPQFNHWNVPIQDWWNKNSSKYPITTEANKPTSYDDVHTPEKKPNITILEPDNQKQYLPNEKINISIQNNSFYPLKKLDIFINGIYTGTTKTSPFNFSFTPNDLTSIQKTNEIKILVEDSVYNTSQAVSEFNVSTN